MQQKEVWNQEKRFGRKLPRITALKLLAAGLQDLLVLRCMIIYLMSGSDRPSHRKDDSINFVSRLILILIPGSTAMLLLKL
eukprot:3755144-Pleurochrysis_carterae.AAC.2